VVPSGVAPHLFLNCDRILILSVVNLLFMWECPFEPVRLNALAHVRDWLEFQLVWSLDSDLEKVEEMSFNLSFYFSFLSSDIHVVRRKRS